MESKSESKFHVGQKVIIVDDYKANSKVFPNLTEDSVLTVRNVKEANEAGQRYLYHFEGSSGWLYECRLAAIDDEGCVTWEGGESWPQ